jgi:hypothetical protein
LDGPWRAPGWPGFFQKAFAKGDIDAVTKRLRSQAVNRAADRAAAGRARRER